MKNTVLMKASNIKVFALVLMTLFMSVQTTLWAEDVTPSVTLTSYYSAANGKSSNALRTALQGIIDDHTVVSYDNLKYLMKYSDTDEANGTDVIDIYSTCTFTSGSSSLSWISSGDVGAGMNREHTVPQAWFDQDAPMVSDAFHIYPTDSKANNNRSSYIYGEFSVAGTSYSSSSCSESGKKSGAGTKTIASYSYGGTTYSPTATYSGIVYEPADEFKGDIARGYFYMATRYASGTGTANCSNWSGGAFGSDNNGFTNYTAELMLKWHRLDPVSRKELIRNEVIYGNTKYNKGDKKQGNRNPFIDYPELVEYIWGNKKGQNVTIADLTSAYEEAGTGTPTTTYNVSLWRHGNTQVVTGLTGDYTLPTTGEADACTSWVFDGWSSSKVTSTTTKPTTYITKATSSTGTAYAVYKKETSSSGAPVRKAMMGTSTVASVTFSNANSDGSADKSSSIADLVESASGISSYSGTKVYAGTTGVKIGTGSATGSITLNLSSAANVKSVVVNAKKYGSDSGTLSVTAGSTAVDNAQSPNATAGDLTFTATNAVSNTTTITVATSTKRAYIKSITVIAEDGGSTTTYTYDSDPSDCKCSGNLGKPNVTATPSDGTITLTWPDVTDATNGYTVTIAKGVGYTTECGDVEIGEVTHSGTTNTCVITGLVNGLNYTTSVVANATATTCESAADEDTATPVGCESWADPTVSYGSYSLTAGGGKTAAPTITGTTYGTATYKSNNENVLQVDGTGRVTPLSAGTATVTVHWTGDATHCPNDVTTSLFTVTGLVRITFNANDGSATPATATQDVTYNVATALTAINTIGFSRTGYTFQGWSTDKNATSAAYTDGGNITITAATTLYAVWQVNKHSVTFTQPTNGGTFTVNSSTTSPVNNVDFGSTVTIAITPTNSHFSVGTVTVSGTGGSVTVNGSGNSRSFTMPDYDVTVSVTLTEDTKYTVNWIVNGTSKNAEQNYAGEALTGLATAPTSADCDDSKVFMGWTATQISGESATAPNDLFTDASTKTMPSNNSTNYYAVFATETTSGSGSTTYDIDFEDATSAYSDWTFSDITTQSDAITAQEGSYHGTTNAKTTAYVQTKQKIASPTSITFYVSKSTNNTTSSTWYVQTSSNGSDWDNIGTQSATSMSKGSWVEVQQSLSTKSNVYVRVYYSGSTAVRCIDNLSLVAGGGSSTTYSEYATSCTHESTVTITFDKNGGGGTMAAQVVNWGEATNLNANTFTAPTGHHFLGWSESSTATIATYANQGSVTYKKDVTLYAIWEANSHQVSYEVVPAGKATVQINSSATTPQNVNYGTTVTVAVTPDTHYSLTSITLSTGGSVAVNGNSGTFTMPDDNVKVTVTVTEDTKYTVTWDVAGSTSTETHYAGVALTGIDAPTSDDCDGSKVFVGWTAHEDYENETTAPDDLFTDPTTKTTPANNTTTYYAVFAEENNGGGSGELINEEFDNTSTSDATAAITSSTFPNFSGSTDKAYKSKYGGLKLGSSNYAGYITSKLLNLSSAFTVTLDVTAYGSDGGNIDVTIYDSDDNQLETKSILNNDFGTGKSLSFAAATSSSKVEIATSTKRAYIDNVVITAGSGTSYSNYATSCVIPTDVTVKFDANGGEGTMADQTIPYNTATKLTKNTFTREGYDFQGWATTASGAKAYDDEEQVTFKKKTTTLYAVWAIKTYNITVVVTPAEGGTASTTPANKAEFGQNVTVNVSADSHYDLTSIVVTKAGGGNVTVTNKQFTMPAEAVTVTVTFTKKTVYTVTWSQNGDESMKVEYIQGETIAFPASATVDCDDKVFIGWSTEAFTETDDAPTTMITSATMGTSNLIYYAVYANAGSGSGSGGGSGSGDYELVESAPTNWAGDYLIAYSSTKFADGRVGGKDASGSIGAEGISVNPGENLSGKVVAATWGDTYNVTIVESATAGKYLLQTKDGKYNYQTNNSNGLSATTTKSTAESYPLTITFSSSSDIDIANAAGAVFHYNTQGYFRFYQNGGQSSIYLYRKGSGSGGGGSGSSYTGYTTSCGASISAKSGKWLTAANGQKVKTAIEVKARGFDAATTLSASSDNGKFSVSLAATAVPVEGLTTTLTIEYMPASAGATESGTITLTAGDVTKTITVNGRSLPDEFLIITKKNSEWKALPANMTGGLGEYDGVTVTPDDPTTPTSVATSPSTLVYTLKAVDNKRYADAGSSVRLVGNNKYCLSGKLEADAVGINNGTKFAETNSTNTDWLLTTTDGVSYTIANRNHADYADGRRLAYGASFGQYKEESVFYFVTTSGCNSTPDNVQAKPRRGDVTFSWVSNATEMKIDVYKNSAMTGEPFKSDTTTTSPYYMSDLDQETDYWYRLTPNITDDACAVTGTFSTVGPTIDIVEWLEDSVVILVDKKPDLKPNIVIEGEVEHGAGTGATATELFFSKYFEAEGTAKMLAIFNGTKNPISLSDVKILHRSTSSQPALSLASYGKTPGTIQPGEEIILFNADSREKIMECAVNDPTYSSWNNTNNNQNLAFGGKGTIRLFRGDKCIDIIGAMTSSAAANDVHNMTKVPMEGSGYPSWGDANGFVTSTGDKYTTKDVVETSYGLSTNRCLLIRKASVTSGDSAVLNNKGDFKTLGIYTGVDNKEHKGEWAGLQIPTASVGEEDYIHTCEGFQEVGHFDYSSYYKDWNKITDKDPSLDSKIVAGGSLNDAENYYGLHINELAKYSCLNLKFNLVDKDDASIIYASKEAQVPILIKENHTTADAIFNEIVKTDGGDPIKDQSIERCKTCEVRILDGATLTKAPNNTENDATEVGNLTIYPGGKLEVPTGRTFTVSTLTYRVENEGSEPEADLQGDLLMKSSTLTVTRRIKNDRYYFFSLPYDCNLSDVHWANSNTPVELNTDYMILEYDGETRAAEGSYIYGTPYWKPIEGDVIKAGKGYNIAVSSSKIKELVFPMAVDDGENNTKTNLTTAEAKKQTGITVGLDEYVGVYTTLDDNWNLIAHPYLTKFTAKPATTTEAWTTQTRSFDPNNSTYAGYLDYGTWNESITWGLAKEGQFEVYGRGAIPSCTSMSDFPWNKYRTAIKSLKISGDITDIGTYAFAQCKELKQVTLAATVTNIGNQAFMGCSQLRYIEIVNPMIISVNEAAFQGVELGAITLTVPEQSAEEFRNHSVWGQMNIKAAENGTSGDGTTHGNSPRRANDQDHYSTVGNGLYITMPEISASGVVTYVPKHVDGLTAFDIKPFSAVFIQGAGKGSVTFKGSGSEAPKRSPWLADNRMEDESVFVGVNISGNGESDLTSLRLRPDYREGYKPTLDLVKSTTYYTERPQLYMITDAGRLAFRAVSDLIAEHCWMPMGIYCRDAGNYTFSLYDRYPLDQVEAVYLRDNVTGTETNLMHSNYTITTDKQLYTNTRFEVRVVLRREVEIDTPTMIDHTEDPNAPRKFFRDGLLYILRDGKIYDATGKPVQFDDMLNR